MLRFRRRSKICVDISSAIITDGFALARSVESSQQWEKVLAQGQVGPVAQVEFLGLGGLQDFHAWVVSLYIQVAEFIRRVVIHRREHDVQAWRSWIWEDRSSRP